MAQETKVLGTITEKHASEIEDVFDADIADAVRNAEAGTTFLDILRKAGRI